METGPAGNETGKIAVTGSNDEKFYMPKWFRKNEIFAKSRNRFSACDEWDLPSGLRKKRDAAGTCRISEYLRRAGANDEERK